MAEKKKKSALRDAWKKFKAGAEHVRATGEEGLRVSREADATAARLAAENAETEAAYNRKVTAASKRAAAESRNNDALIDQQVKADREFAEQGEALARGQQANDEMLAAAYARRTPQDALRGNNAELQITQNAAQKDDAAMDLALSKQYPSDTPDAVTQKGRALAGVMPILAGDLSPSVANSRTWASSIRAARRLGVITETSPGQYSLTPEGQRLLQSSYGEFRRKGYEDSELQTLAPHSPQDLRVPRNQ